MTKVCLSGALVRCEVTNVSGKPVGREMIYRDDEDRAGHLAVFAQAMGRFDALVLAYRSMGNHFHLVLQTQRANLSRLMRHVMASIPRPSIGVMAWLVICFKGASRRSWP